jgi:arylsulfatase A-like enzyme
VLAGIPALRGLDAEEMLEASRWQKRFAAREPAPSGPELDRYRERRAALYDASVEYVDRELARAVSAFDARARPLLLVFTADHGEEFWEHAELERARFDDPRGLYGVGHGHTLFDELVRVPLFFHAPGTLAPASVDAPVSLVDVLPTIVELVGARHAAPLQGRSLVPALAGGALSERALFFGEPCFGGDQRGILSDGLKLIVTERAGNLLFDTAVDPGERDDLALRADARLAALTAELERHGRDSRALRAQLVGASVEEPQELTPRELETLRDLGYLGEQEEER